MGQTIVIVGGGAAGFFCAANIIKTSDTKIILLERSQKCLSKVRISGGGRCNVTHNSDSIPAMSKKYPRGEKFVRKTFHQFFVADTIAWFAARGLKLKTEADNRMFPVTDDSQSVIEVLTRAVNKNGVDIRLGQHVYDIVPKEQGFTVFIKGHEDINADQLVIASGGFPKLDMFDWLKNLGHDIAAPVPSLFTFNIPRNPITDLMGLSVPEGTVKILGTKLQESGPVLITHWGLSGPGVLKTSAYGALQLATMNYNFQVQVNWLADYNEESFRQHLMVYKQEHPHQKLSNITGLPIPQRLWNLLLLFSEIEEAQRWVDLPARQLNKLAKNVTALEMKVSGKTTFKEEFVTAGGIELSGVDSQSMQSKYHEGLYFAGELLNIDGVTGGFNFQNAWTTGWIAANAISAKI
ncbi:MAG: NAD(P)/FAD-dependent oxidoreductase [Sphingobacteriales bacterium]|nr:MAG: NAD(P)/FAD-dependent oxidoreductase [Sphingobacteriales bacterium]